MIILGLEAYFHDTSASILVDGDLIYAVQEERLTRHKRTRDFPLKAINTCLNKAGITIKDVEICAFPVNPGIYLEHFDGTQSGLPRYRGEIWHSVLNNLMTFLPHGYSVNNSTQSVTIDGYELKIQYVEHHLAHAASAFYPSGFNESAILTIDGFGEKDCLLLAIGNKNTITPLFKQEFPHSLGAFYKTITEFLGFRPNNDEWKVMGASSYGNESKYFDKLFSLFKLKQQGFELDLSYFNFYNFHRPLTYSKKMIELLGSPRYPGEPIKQIHFDIAMAAQKVTEEVVFHLADNLYRATGMKKLCYGGGVAMNSVCNGKIVHATPFEDLYIPYSPDDSGGCIGAALYTYHQLNNKPRKYVGSSNYLGPEYEDSEIQKDMEIFDLQYYESKDPAKEAARLIADGHIIGWFQGRVEFGDRALGNRSILADPRAVEMKDIINNRVKFREEFRPFAPAILEEYLDEYFITPSPTPFMEKVFMIKKEKREEIPAVVHVDGSGRLQSVSLKQNPLFYNLIKNFRDITGIPVVLNTSFNLKDEPIVCSPKDAIRTFFSSGINVLFLSKYVLVKRQDIL